MNFVLCGDCHFTSQQPVSRLDNVLEASINKWSSILQFALQHEAAVLIAGDFCDKPRDWYLLPRLMSVMAQYRKVNVYAVYGQHDMYMRSEGGREATNLGVLAKAGMIKILDKKGAWFGAGKPAKPWCVRGCHWGEEIPTIEKDNLSQRYEPRYALVIHASIAKEAVYPGHSYIKVGDLIKMYPEYELIMCGDVHRRFLAVGPDKQLIINSGPIMRLEANDYNMNLNPSVLFYSTDTGKYEWHQLPAARGRDVLSRDHIQAREDRKMLLDTFIASIDKSTQICRTRVVDRVIDWINQNEEQYPEVAHLLDDICGLQKVSNGQLG